MKINGKIVKAEVVSTFCEETSQLLKAETFFAVESECQSPPYDIDAPSKNESVLLGLADRVNASDKEFDINHWHLSRYVYGSKDWQRYGEAELIDFESRQREIENDPYSRLDSVVETYGRL